MVIELQNSIFSFYLCENSNPKIEFESTHSIGKYNLYTDSNTPIDYSILGDRELIVFGYAVDVFTGQSKDLAETVLEATKDLKDVIEYEKKLGGKYVIFYNENGKCYCIGDATCSVPIFYSTESQPFICGSNLNLIAEVLSLSEDSELLKVRRSGELNQAMPFDVTTYKDIKQLIPNHYVDFELQKSIRFVNEFSKQRELSPEIAAKITAPMIEKLSEFYFSKFKVHVPLTSGRDSRVVFAFLSKTPTYTVWQERFKNDDQDWVIPRQLTTELNVPYEQIYNEEISGADRCQADRVLGKNSYSDDTLRLALTLNKHYGDGAIIEGDIMGQVGKCSLHRDIPNVLATPAYFRCKLHNYSEESKILLGEWLKEIKATNEKVNTFDLFSIENRLGRWAAQTHIMHNSMGQLYLNIFNSRSIIYTWTAVPRNKRKFSEIHIELIKLKSPKLLSVPFERDKNGLIQFAKSNGIIFYFASYAKYFIQRRQFNKKTQEDI